MTIDEAIRHLQRKVRQNVFTTDPEAFEALQLGIEALKRVKMYRKAQVHYCVPELQGETPERDADLKAKAARGDTE